MTKHTLTLAIFLLLNLFSFSQSSYIIKGRVSDSETKKALSDATVQIFNETQGTTTDAKGYFTINTNKLPIKIIVRHLGYLTKYISVKTDSSILNIELTPEATLLKGVTINEKRVSTVFKDDYYSILDFKFMGNNLLLLVYKQQLSRSQLVLLNDKEDTLAILPLKIKTVSLFKDCFDNIHLIANDSTYQIYYNNHNLELLYPYSKEQFNQLLVPCLAQTNNSIFLKDQPNKFAIQYYSINRTSKKHKILQTIIDSTQIEQYIDEIKYNEKEQRFNQKTLNANNVSMQDGQSLMFSDDPYLAERAAFQERLLINLVFKTIYNPLIKLNDTLCIINYTNNKIEFYNNEGTFVRSVPITFHLKKSWKKYPIIVNEEQKRIFALFKEEDLYQLKEIDLNNGSILKTYTTGLPFPEEIKIKNGYIYFLYQTSIDSKRQLIKQILN